VGPGYLKTDYELQQYIRTNPCSRLEFILVSNEPCMSYMYWVHHDPIVHCLQAAVHGRTFIHSFTALYSTVFEAHCVQREPC